MGNGPESIVERYLRTTPKSAALTRAAERVMPGGETRNSVFHRPYSLTVEHGSGTQLWDVDGNSYFDLNNNYTCLVHGHAYPPVVDAINGAVARGTTWSAKAASQIELAEILIDRVASVDLVRFANSGGEAVQMALAIARGCTGRAGVLMSTYAYHGHFLDANHYRGTNMDVPNFVETYLAAWGDAEDFERILTDYGHRIAMVVLEPWLGAAGMIGAEREFFVRVAAATRRAGALFVLDEATAFRLAFGGAQSLLDMQPDLTVLGKMVGGGLPFGAVGGRLEFMEVTTPGTGSVAISGTFSGNPVTMAAGIPAMRNFTSDVIERMGEQAASIESALVSSAKRHGVPFSVRRVGSLMNVWIADQAPAANHVRRDEQGIALFHLACLVNGIFTAPRGLINLSSPTTSEEIAEIERRFDTALSDVARELPPR